MPAAPLPLNEAARLDALFHAAILDTEAEAFFEDTIDGVQLVVPTPIALISLVDEWRQWFKARRGLEASETPRDHAFCAYAILDEAPLVVADAREDARFQDNPLVTGEPHVIAYAGAPIILDNGAKLGTVCAIDSKPRDWTTAEIAHIERAARIVARYVDARRALLEQDRQRFLEMALTRAEARYQSVLESMSEGMVVHGASGAIIDSNPAASDMLGLSKEQLFGREPRDPRWRAVFPSGEAIFEQDHPALVTQRTGAPQHGIVIGIETPSQERRWLNCNFYPVRRPSDGRVDQVVMVFRVIAFDSIDKSVRRAIG